MDRAIVKDMGPVLVPMDDFRPEVQPWLLMIARARCRAYRLLRRAPSARRAHSATFEIVGWRLELSTSPGAARLEIVGDRARDTHMVEPGALAAWAVATTKLLSLQPAESARGRAAIRAPFLVDRDGQPTIAFEALVSEYGVGYRLLIGREQGPGASLVTTDDVLRGMAQAAEGIGRLARPSR